MNQSDAVVLPKEDEIEIPSAQSPSTSATEVPDEKAEEPSVDSPVENNGDNLQSSSLHKANVLEIDVNSILSSSPLRIDGDVLDRNLEADSNAQYDHTVSQIVDIAKKHLLNQNNEKTKIRNKLIVFFIILLSFQMLAVVVFIALSACGCVDFVITDYLQTVFITSVFVETLGAITIMIVFAFGSKEEVEVIGLLTAIIKNYQKFRRNNGNDPNHKKHKK